MAELTQSERLQPSLLDRLMDDHPDKRKHAETEPGVGVELDRSDKRADAGSHFTGVDRTSRDREGASVINSRQLREYVKRDLAWLLNSGNLEDVLDLSAFPNVADSVLNFGIPDLTGLVASNVDTQALERKLTNVISRFEPRILKRSLRISVSTSQEMSRNALIFEIECDVWGQPVPERMYLHSEIDFEDGTINFREHGG